MILAIGPFQILIMIFIIIAIPIKISQMFNTYNPKKIEQRKTEPKKTVKENNYLDTYLKSLTLIKWEK